MATLAPQASFDGIRPRLMAEVPAVVRDHGRLLGIDVLDARGHTCSRSFSLSLRFEQRPLAAFLKCYEWDDDSGRVERWAEREFRVLEALHRASLSGAGPAVVRPLLLLPELPAILMEAQSGRVFNSLLRGHRLPPFRAETSLPSLRARLSGVGSALARLHRVLADHPATRERLAGSLPEAWTRGLSPTREHARGQMAALERHSDRLCERALGHLGPDLARVIREGFDGAKREALPLLGREFERQGSLIHADFTPMNVFVDGPAVTFFDFVNSQIGHPYEDVTRMHTYLRFLGRHRWQYRPADVAALSASFFEGYGFRTEASDPVLRFFHQRSMFRIFSGGLRFHRGVWLLQKLYRASMLRVLRGWVDAGMSM